jgi:hypothetical protein
LKWKGQISSKMLASDLICLPSALPLILRRPQEIAHEIANLIYRSSQDPDQITTSNTIVVEPHGSLKQGSSGRSYTFLPRTRTRTQIIKDSIHNELHWNVSLPLPFLVLFLLPLYGQPFGIHRLSLHTIFCEPHFNLGRLFWLT